MKPSEYDSHQKGEKHIMAFRLLSRRALVKSNVQKRTNISRQVWDIYGNINNQEARHIRHGFVYEFVDHWPYMKQTWKMCVFCPMIFILWENGVFDYIFRKRYIPPLEPDWEAEFPYRPPPGYQNPFIPPGRLF